MPNPDSGWSNGYFVWSLTHWPLTGLLQNQPSCDPAESLTMTVHDSREAHRSSSDLPSCRIAGGAYCSLMMTSPSGIGPCRPLTSHFMTPGEYQTRTAGCVP